MFYLQVEEARLWVSLSQWFLNLETPTNWPARTLALAVILKSLDQTSSWKRAGLVVLYFLWWDCILLTSCPGTVHNDQRQQQESSLFTHEQSETWRHSCVLLCSWITVTETTTLLNKNKMWFSHCLCEVRDDAVIHSQMLGCRCTGWTWLQRLWVCEATGKSLRPSMKIFSIP